MRVRVNGEPIEVEAGSSVGQLLGSLRIPAASVVVEKNGEILVGEGFGAALLEESDRLEIVRFVGGG